MKRRRSFEAQITRLSFISSALLLVLLLGMMIYAHISVWLILLMGFVGVIYVGHITYQIYERLAYQFRSLNSLLDALTRGEYSLRARPHQRIGELDELVMSINGLAARLSQQRRESVESQLLANTIIQHIDVAIVAVNADNEIRFYNPAAKNLLLLDQMDSNSQLVSQLAIFQNFPSGHNQVVELSLGYQRGRFNVHVEEFRESGLQHQLLFITDVRTLLRSEERKAWQSLVRVISHEINNSLSPIASISLTLNRLVQRNENNINIQQDLIEGLGIINERTNGLSQFVNSYKQLAMMPDPQREMVSISKIFRKISVLFKEYPINIQSDSEIELFIDPFQFEQVLINLFKNAVESMAQVKSNGTIDINWVATEHTCRITICDQGAGISNPENIFVPFYSTKKHGSGVGLVLCRQIIEAHYGSLTIANRITCCGCCALIELPLISHP